MSWSAITADEVMQEFNYKEQQAIQSAQANEDNLPPILARAVNAARACVIAGGGQVDQDGTIPDQLRADVITIARWKWLLSLPQVNEELQSNPRRNDYEASMKRMDDVAAGKIKIELPATPIVQAAPDNAIEVASSQPRRFTQKQMEGL